MPVSIFLFSACINLVIGGIYFLFWEHIKKGREIYVIVVLLITALIAFFTAFNGRHSTPALEKFRGLLLPLFTNHPNLFLTDKDIRGEE